jgi:hypothetical protein
MTLAHWNLKRDSVDRPKATKLHDDIVNRNSRRYHEALLVRRRFPTAVMMPFGANSITVM